MKAYVVDVQITVLADNADAAIRSVENWLPDPASTNHQPVDSYLIKPVSALQKYSKEELQNIAKTPHQDWPNDLRAEVLELVLYDVGDSYCSEIGQETIDEEMEHVLERIIQTD